MQPRPSADTSKPWLPSFLLSIDSLLIYGDLAFDEGEVTLCLRQLGPHRLPVLLEQRQALALVAAGPHQLVIATDARDRHPACPQAADRLHPLHVGLAVAAVPGRGA